MSLYTVKQMAMRYPGLTEGALRKLIFNRYKNGFHVCIVRIPGSTRILICEMSFLKLIKDYNNGLDECTPTNGNEAKPYKSRTYNRPNFEALSNDEDLYASEIESESDKKDDDEGDDGEPSFDF